MHVRNTAVSPTYGIEKKVCVITLPIHITCVPPPATPASTPPPPSTPCLPPPRAFKYYRCVFAFSGVTNNHGLINNIVTKAECCHLRKFTCKGTLRRCLLEFIDWRYSQSCWYFRPSCVKCCPSLLLSGSSIPTSPPPPRVKKYIVYTRIQCVRGGTWFWVSDR